MRKQITEIELCDDITIAWVDLDDDIHIPTGQVRGCVRERFKPNIGINESINDLQLIDAIDRVPGWPSTPTISSKRVFSDSNVPNLYHMMAISGRRHTLRIVVPLSPEGRSKNEMTSDPSDITRCFPS